MKRRKKELGVPPAAWAFTLNFPDDEPKIVIGYLEYGQRTYDVWDKFGGKLLFSIPYTSLKFVDRVESDKE